MPTRRQVLRLGVPAAAGVASAIRGLVDPYGLLHRPSPTVSGAALQASGEPYHGFLLLSAGEDSRGSVTPPTRGIPTLCQLPPGQASEAMFARLPIAAARSEVPFPLYRFDVDPSTFSESDAQILRHISGQVLAAGYFLDVFIRARGIRLPAIEVTSFGGGANTRPCHPLRVSERGVLSAGADK
jgi:hypothetical protein